VRDHNKNVNVNNYRAIKPPFGYYGSKQRIAETIINKLPPHHAWVEAFCGSAAVTLAKAPAPIEIINDLDDQVVNLFKQLRNNPTALFEAVSLTPYARAEYKKAKQHEYDISPLEKARRFLVATMMTVNGANGGDNAGFSFSQSYSREGREARVNRWYNLPERLELVVERLRNIRIENRDARKLISMFQDRPATLIYLDPPYLMNRNQLYNVDALDESFHTELLNLCCISKAMIFISGYDNDLYNSILTAKRGWRKEFISTTTRGTSGKDRARIEVVWKNKQFMKAIGKNKPPIELTAEEVTAKKLNPPR
jgi:DNA adenine methylase